MKVKSIDIVIIILFYFSIIIGFYFNGLSQSNDYDGTMAPLFVLLLPFGVVVLQLIRLLSLKDVVKLDLLSKSWVYIFCYYIFAFLWGAVIGVTSYHYNTIWFIVIPPITWVYFSSIVKINVSVSEILINWSFWIMILLSTISLYFIPRSINQFGYFASLNTGYYVLLSYPMVMLNKSKIKKIIATILTIFVVVLSMKRGGVLAVFLSIALYVLVSAKTSVFRKVLVVIIVVLFLVYMLPIIDNLTGGTLQRRIEFTQNLGDEEGRYSMYPIVWHAVWESSFVEVLLGHGHNAIIQNDILHGLSAHNDYLEFLYDYGIVGFYLLLVYQWRLIKLTWKTRKDKTESLSTIFALVSIIVLSMVSVVYAYHYFLLVIPFWCLIINNQKERSNI